MKWSALNTAALCLSLAGCSSMPPRPAPVPPPAELLTPCPTPAPRSAADLGAVLTLAVDALDALAECAARHRALSDYTRGSGR